MSRCGFISKYKFALMVAPAYDSHQETFILFPRIDGRMQTGNESLFSQFRKQDVCSVTVYIPLLGI